jgi:hypothetical protein
MVKNVNLINFFFKNSIVPQYQLLKNISCTHFFYLIVILLPGCATDGIHDFRSLMVAQHLVTEPTKENNFTGLLTETTQSSPQALEKRAIQICSSRGGIFSNPKFSHDHEFYGWKIYRYQCNGMNAIVNNNPPPTDILSQEIKNKVVEPTLSTSTNNLSKDIPPNQDLNRKNESQVSDDTVSVVDAKNKCKQLGFKEKTEKFGSCVLRLSK